MSSPIVLISLRRTGGSTCSESGTRSHMGWVKEMPQRWRTSYLLRTLHTWKISPGISEFQKIRTNPWAWGKIQSRNTFTDTPWFYSYKVFHNYLPISKPVFLGWWTKKTSITFGKMKTANKLYFSVKPFCCRLLAHWFTVLLPHHWSDLKSLSRHSWPLQSKLEDGVGAVRSSSGEV